MAPLARQIASLLTLAVLAPSARSLTAQARAVDVVVHGLVFDSIAHRRLAGAQVQFVPHDTTGRVRTMTALTDSGGGFDVRLSVGERYLAGFFHAAVDTIGIELRARDVVISDTSRTVVLAVPSALTIRRQLCAAAGAGPDSSSATGLLVGHVHNEDESARPDAAVTVSWSAPHVAKDWIGVEDHDLTVMTNAEGFFVVCGIPSDASFSLVAAAGRDSVRILDSRMLPDGVTHTSLYLGSPMADMRTRVSGAVIDEGGRPIADAGISFQGSGREARSSADGHFAIDSLRGGTQTMRVRAIGYAAVDTSVHLVSATALTVRITLKKLVVLPAMTSTAAAAEAMAIFRSDQKAAFGGFFIVPLHPTDYPPQTPLLELLKGLPSPRPRRGMPRSVQPLQIFVDGKHWRDGTVTDLSYEIDPADIIAIEVYQLSFSAPPRYGTTAPVLSVWTRKYHPPT